MSETDVTLSVGLNVADAEKTAEQLNKEVQKIFESNNGQSSASLTRVELQLKKTSKEAGALSEHLEALKSTKVFDEDIHSLKDAQVLLGKVKGTYEELLDAREQLDDMRIQALANGGSLEIDGELKTAKDLEETIDKTNDAILEMMSAMEVLQDRIATEQALDTMNDKIKQQIIHYHELIALEEKRAKMAQERADREDEKADRKERADIRRDKQDSHAGATAITKTLKEISETIPGLKDSTQELIGDSIEGVQTVSSLMSGELMASVDAVKRAVAGLFTFISAHPVIAIIMALVAAITIIAKQIKEAYDALKKEFEEFFKRLQDGFKRLIELSRQFFLIITRGLANIAMTGPKMIAVGLRGLKLLIDRLMSLKSLIMENLTIMAEWRDGNNDVNKALSNITSSLAYLKATLATAVAPILIAIEPIITRIINAIGEALTQIGMFIAKITGAKYFQKAIRKQKDYAKSLKETQGQLAGFDKLNVLNDRKSEDVDFGLIDIEKIPIDDWLTDLKELGKLLGTWIRDNLNKIPWDLIKKKAKEAGAAIADFINGFTGVAGLGRALGKSFGEIINTFTSFIRSFFATFDGRQFGKWLWEMFDNLRLFIDWKELGRSLTDPVNAVSDILIGMFTASDEKTPNELGKMWGRRISDMLQAAIENIDWKDVKQALSLLGTQLADVFNELFTEENMIAIADTIINGIDSAFALVGSFIAEGKVSDWFVNIAKGINEFFEKMPADEWAQKLNETAMAILDGIMEALDRLDIETIGDKLVEVLNGIDWDKLAEKISAISDKLYELVTKVWDKLEEAGVVDKILKFVATVVLEKISWFGNGDNKKGFFGDMKDDLISREINLESIIGYITKDKKSVAKKTKEPKYDEETEMYALPGWEPFSNAKKTMDTWAEQSILAGAEIGANLITSMDTAINTEFNNVDWSHNYWDKIPEEAKKSLGIASPSKVFIEIGKMVVEGFLLPFTALKDKFVQVWDLIRKIGISAVSNMSKNIIQILTQMSNNINQILTQMGNNLIGTFTVMISRIKSQLSSVMASGIDFSAFTDSMTQMGKAWDSLWDKMSKKSKDKTNDIIKYLNSLIEGYETMVNIKFEETKGNKPEKAIELPRIPYLAQGAVIPPNNQFLAVLGDQRSGTNIEAPLSTIEQAVRNVLNDFGVNVTFDVKGDPTGMFKVMQSESQKFTRRTGLRAFP